jgi:UDP-3-O-[3-hydroxymyristoyl] glucosamine N-acyltransferase
MNFADIFGRIPKSRSHLSVLKLAGPNCITYYVGENADHVAHLQDCTLFCKPEFKPELAGVDVIEVNDPQLAFYRLSKAFKVDYLEYGNMSERQGARVHRDAVVPASCTVGPGSVLGACTLGENVRIEANCVIYARTEIGDNTVIEPNTVIGATGVMWMWDEGEKVFLEQIGGVRIQQDCFIGSNVTIVRGSANENTLISKDTCMNVSLGGSVISGRNCFFGSGSVVSPRIQLCADVIVGAGALLSKNATESGIYVGVPAKRTSAIKEQMSGIPKWNSQARQIT